MSLLCNGMRRMRQRLSAGRRREDDGALHCSRYRLRPSLPGRCRIHGPRQPVRPRAVPGVRRRLRRLRRRMRQAPGCALPGLFAGMPPLCGRMPPHGGHCRISAGTQPGGATAAGAGWVPNHRRADLGRADLGRVDLGRADPGRVAAPPECIGAGKRRVHRLAIASTSTAPHVPRPSRMRPGCGARADMSRFFRALSDPGAGPGCAWQVQPVPARRPHPVPVPVPDPVRIPAPPRWSSGGRPA